MFQDCNSELIFLNLIFFIKKSGRKFDFLKNIAIIESVEFEEVLIEMSLIAKNWWLFSRDTSYRQSSTVPK